MPQRLLQIHLTDQSGTRARLSGRADHVIVVPTALEPLTMPPIWWKRREWRLRDRRSTARENEGALVLEDVVLDGDLIDAMIEQRWFGEWDRRDKAVVLKALMDTLREALLTREI